MRLFGALMVLLGGLSYLLTLARASLPFRIPVTDHDAIGLAVALGAAGLLLVLGASRSRGT